MKFTTELVFVALFVILLGVCLSEEGINQQENEEQPNLVPIEEFDKTDETDSTSEQQSLTEMSNAAVAQSEVIKRKITDAVISRARKLREELSSSEVGGDRAKEFEEKVLDKMDELSVSDIVDILSEVLSNDEEIKQLIQDIYDSGVNEEEVLEMLKIDGNFIISRVKEVSQDAIPIKDIKSTQVEYFQRRASQLDTDLLMLCPQETQHETQQHTGITLSTDDVEFLNGLLDHIQISTGSKLSDVIDSALEGTQYSNYSRIMYRLLFGDRIVPRNFTLALIFANFLSDKGLPSAHNILGFIYKTGYSIFNESEANNTKPNTQTALTYYTFGALGGDVMSEMALGYRYHKGLGVLSSCAKALVYYQRVGRKMLNQIGLSGGPALYKIRLSDDGDESVNGNTMNQDLVEFFQMLAHKGDTSSTNLLGQLFLQGTRGAERNVLTAIKYFEIAAEERDETALVTLGMIYGDCTLKGITDYKKAISYLEEAVRMKSHTAKAVLGFLYLTGLGVNQDFQRARQLIEPGVKANNAEATLYFGIMLYYGYGIAKNTDQALRHLIKVSEAGNLLAIYYLAKVNAGQARHMDPLKPCQSAVKLHKGVAERGYWSHLLMVAYKSYKAADYQRAYLLYSYLAEMGYEVAQSNTAFLLENHQTDILPQLSDSDFRAFHQWMRSADQGSSLSKIRMGDYNYYGIGRAVNYDKAIYEYKEAAKDQNPQAKFNMGFMYERGLGVAKDFPLAKRHYDECLSLEPDSFIAVHLALFNLLLTSQFDWVTSSVNLPFSINPLSFIVSFVVNWDIYLITILVMVLGLVYLMYKQHLAQFT